MADQPPSPIAAIATDFVTIGDTVNAWLKEHHTAVEQAIAAVGMLLTYEACRQTITDAD